MDIHHDKPFSSPSQHDDENKDSHPQVNERQKLREEVKRLAVEVDTALATVQSHQDPSAPDYFTQLQLAIDYNTEYRRTVFRLLQIELSTTSLNITNKMAEGILLANVAALWLWGQQDNLEVGVWNMARDAHQLAMLLLPSKPPPVTRQDVIHRLQEMLPGHYALQAFCHQWNVARWIVGRNRPETEDDTKQQLLKNDEPNKTKESGRSDADDDNKVQYCWSQLQIRAALFQALILHDRVLQQTSSQDPINNTSEQKQSTAIIRQRDEYLEQAVQVEEMMQAHHRRGNVKHKKIAAQLRCLIQATSTSNITKKITAQEFTDCFPSNSMDSVQPTTDDAALLNLFGCLLAHGETKNSVTQALSVFQKVLQKDPHRHETIANMAHCWVYLGETQRAVKMWKHLLAVCHCNKSTSGRSRTDEIQLASSHKLSTQSLQKDYYLQRQEAHHGDPRELLLWHLFQVSSLSADMFQDMLRAADGLMERGFVYAHFVHAFTLLQTGQPRAALEVIVQSKQATTKKSSSSLQSICEILYEMDAKLELEAGGVVALFSLCQHAVNMWENKLPQLDPAKIRTLPEWASLQAILYNNQGITCIMEGRNEEDAIRCFQVSCQAVRNGPDSTSGLILLQPFYNLTLLYWNARRIEEAVKTWSDARGFELDNLTELRARWNTASRASSSCDGQEPNVSLHVSTWKPKFSWNKQTFTLDCIILQSVIQQLEHRSLRSWVREMTCK